MKPELQSSHVDHVVSAIKGVIGAAPVAGPIIAELVGTTIPNQRLERVARFVHELDQRISALETKPSPEQLHEPGFTEVAEEAMLQSMRTPDPDRISQLATLTARALSPDEIRAEERLHLLRLLGELSPIELIWLQSFHEIRTMGQNDFYDQHEEVLRPISRTMGQPEHVFDKGALQDSFKGHLERLGLVKPSLEIDRTTGIPVFDKQTGKPKIRGYDVTQLGFLLLKEIGIEIE
jgi:hypothetical protein